MSPRTTNPVVPKPYHITVVLLFWFFKSLSMKSMHKGIEIYKFAKELNVHLGRDWISSSQNLTDFPKLYIELSCGSSINQKSCKLNAN